MTGMHILTAESAACETVGSERTCCIYRIRVDEEGKCATEDEERSANFQPVSHFALSHLHYMHYIKRDWSLLRS